MNRFKLLACLTCAGLLMLLVGCKTSKSSASDDDDQEAGRDRPAAIVGGKAGAVIGRQMQVQKEALEAAFPADATVETVNRGEVLKLTFSAASLFEANANTLTEMSRISLRLLALHLNSNPGVRVKIVGYMDNTGRSAFNRILSTRRAKSVCDLLTENGVDAARTTYEGKGIHHPVASNRTAKGRALNRRIEIFILPGEEMIRDAHFRKK